MKELVFAGMLVAASWAHQADKGYQRQAVAIGNPVVQTRGTSHKQKELNHVKRSRNRSCRTRSF